MPIEPGDRVTLEYIGRKSNGMVFDTSRDSVAEESGLAEEFPDREFQTLTIDIGAGRVIEGLEEGLQGLKEGERAVITVAPQEGYGERTDENVVTYDVETFERILQGDEIEVGMHVQSQQGDVGQVTRADEESVEVDFNHELAGETLEFEVEILSIEKGDA
ncbi:MAG: FKBP-type peptidyl-prolyl cis-trans isomerase [Halobacteriales archaeon]|nr:FKBP-type peptidyl-prolyl cis-trans isomerase [Halobacteriales archaeon]